MCTVTFIPTAQHYYITSNRDESPDRRDKGLISKQLEQGTIYFPLDESSGGSWIALSVSGRVVCLLNGALEKFIYRPPYRISRGEVVMAMTSANDPERTLYDFNLEAVAPFTLLMFEHGLFKQLIWDGRARTITDLENQEPKIWSSVTLYPADVRQYRKELFDQWISQGKMQERESIINFHLSPGNDPENDFIMNRNEVVKTLSVTSVEIKKDVISMLHYDLDKPAPEEIRVRHAE